MKPIEFVDSLASLSFTDVFNPYADRCEVFDLADAPLRRRKILLEMLEAATKVEIDAIWIGRDLGHRGGRRTGLALTDDIHYASHLHRWNLLTDRPTKGTIVAERTAAVIWKMLDGIEEQIFLWNVFPFHPHESDSPFSNRSHKSHERCVGEQLLSELVRMLKPNRLIAIGNDAARTASRISSTRVMTVRHPSYGGTTDFLQQTEAIYGSSQRLSSARLL